MLANTKDFWTSAWSRHYDTYYSAVPRQAYYLDFVLDGADRRLLEIGAGSFRDSVRLNEWGYDCTGTDFSDEAATRAKAGYPQFAEKLHAMDASALEFEDNAFDVSFHNGFFVLFEDDAVIQSFLQEQLRVTKRKVICTVHNALNTQRVEKFRELSESDSLYDIRFFTPDEIKAVLEPHCTKVELFPFGVRTMDRLIRRVPWKSPLKYIYKGLPKSDFSDCERVMAVGHLAD